MKKVIFGFLALVVIAVAGIGVYIYLNGTSLIKQAIVDYGPELTGTPVGVSGVTMMPLTGKAGVSGLSVGTPSGYSAPYTFKVDDVSVGIQPQSLLDTVLVIDDISISAPSIVYEPKGSSSNIQEIQKTLEQYTAGSESDATAGPEKVIIKRLAITQPEVVIYAGGLIGEQSVTAQDVLLTDIGVAEGGISPSDVATAIMAQLQPQILSALKSAAGKELLNQALQQAVAKGLPVDDLKGLADGNVTDLINNDDVKDKVKKGLGSLFD